MNWYTSGQRQADHEAAIAAAKRATIAVVFAWSRWAPFFELAGAQDELIEEIAAVNPNTSVVLNTSQPVALGWANRVKAILEMWWPGDEGGWATANLLLGKISPAGRLPVTWARRLKDHTATDPRYPECSGKGPTYNTIYSEGVLVGYRWFDHESIEPLFPFGHGLSYTTFKYSRLHVVRADDGGLTVTFRITNTGEKDGDEVPQIYLGAPDVTPRGVSFPIRSLAAFDRISPGAGELKTLSLHVALRQSQYWSSAVERWVKARGRRMLSAGASSRDMRLKQINVLE